MAVNGWLRLGAIALVAALAPVVPAAAQSPAQSTAQSTAIAQDALQLAVCLNDWSSAIARASQLEQTPGLPIKNRAELIVFRRQMQLWRQEQAIIGPIDGCEPVLAGFGVPGYTGRPLAIERALANAGYVEPIVIPDLVLRREEALWQAGLGVTADTPLGPLGEAQRINTRTGSGVSTGSVSRQVDVYAFLAAEGDIAHLDLNVIQQRPGLLYTDDSSLLFLFDTEGHLLAAANATPAQQPRLEAIPLPRAGIYYAAVTTPQHRPVLDEGGLLVGWEGIGTSAIAYTLTVSGLTPSPQLGAGR